MQIARINYKFSVTDTYISVPDTIKGVGDIVIESPRGIFLVQLLRFAESDVNLDREVKFVRVATEEDKVNAQKLQEKVKEVKEIADKLIAKNKCDMKVVDVDFTLDDSKVIISFVCEDRVDFRELVRDLASELKHRIELRQIGVRDQARQLGCMGICGKECCCKQYLNDFDKVSIKMAKTQNLSLNPTKISGTCGRLMCCLAFENDTYAELGKNCLKVGSKVSTPDGNGVVLNNNILKQTSLCKIEKGDDIKVAEYPLDKIKPRKDSN